MYFIHYLKISLARNSLNCIEKEKWQLVIKELAWVNKNSWIVISDWSRYHQVIDPIPIDITKLKGK